jgi:hypothetical protein
MNAALDLEQLYRSQLEQWALADENYAALSRVMVRPVSVSGCQLLLQFNPKRIISTSAKVDTRSINERPCFLCTTNRPPEQKGLPCLDEFLVLVNPYPVFHHHFTIISNDHRPQRIRNHFGKLLKITEMMEEYTIFYNGPACGASAPDHFHFQAIPKEILPLEQTWIALFTRQYYLKGVEVYTPEGYPGKMITFAGSDAETIEQFLQALYKLLSETIPAVDEPMMNVLAYYRNKRWTIHIVPRRAHRPVQYFEAGENQLLLSPASIDMGGVLVIPRESDFSRITKADIEDVFRQVCVDDFFIDEIIKKLKHEYEQQ